MYKTIRFHGVLRERFGKEWRVQADSVKEAMRLLSAQLQGLEQFLMNAHTQGLRFAVFTNKRKTISEQEVDMDTGAHLIRIMPVVEGAGGNGVLQTVLGAVLIVVGVVVTGMSFGSAAPVGAALIGAGIGMMVGGVVQMLMPKTKTEDSNADGNKANKGFGSAVTTVAQGNPVPILYGEFEIGGFVLNGGQYPEDQL